MKIYRIKIGHYLYVQSILISAEQPHISCVITPDKEEAGIFEEDKAKIYCKELNNDEIKNSGLEITLEEVIKSDTRNNK